MTALPSADDVTTWRELARLSRRLAAEPGAKARRLAAAVSAAGKAVVPPEHQVKGVDTPFTALRRQADAFTRMLGTERIAAAPALLEACAAVDAALTRHSHTRPVRFVQACAATAELRRRADVDGPF